MKCNYVISIVLVVSSILFLQAGCQEQAKSSEKPETGLVTPEPIVAPSEKTEVAPKAGESAPSISFEKVVHDFGQIEPGAKKLCEFKFTNTGNGLLKITNVERCCGVVTKLSKNEYAPGESGVLKVDCRASNQPGELKRSIYVNSNDTVRPRIELSLKASIMTKISYEPKKINLLLKGENAGCPEITLTSVDNKPFSIKDFKSTGDCITADVNSLVAAPKIVLSPKVDIEKLQENQSGLIAISLNHPTVSEVTITYNTLPEFKTNPPVIIVFNAEPNKPVKRDVWILNNYGQDFEVESVSSKSGIIKVLSQKKIDNRYEFNLEITPPPIEGKKRIFTDVFSVNIKGGEKLEISCRGFYSPNLEPSSG